MAAEEEHTANEKYKLAVLNNQNLVEKILEKVTDDIRNNMELRLVSRIFRDACHANFRKTHRNLRIEWLFVKAEDRDTQERADSRVYINYKYFTFPNVNTYLSFLQNIAKVKIQSIVVNNLWLLEPISFHESIRLLLDKNNGESFKKLIGMDQICHGNCEACLWIPNGCVEYGPLQFETLRKSLTEPHVFEKLIVPDYLLDDIANSCVELSDSKEDCFKAMSDLISSNISCKTLILKMSETRKESIDPEMNDEIQERRRDGDHQPMPREVIEVMLKQWKVQSLVLEFVYHTHRKDYKGEWARKEWFTKLCFSDSNMENLDLSLKFKEVTIDLTRSSQFSSHLTNPDMFNTPNRSYQHLPAIVRRVFQNDKLRIQLYSHSRTMMKRIDHIVQGVFQNIRNGDLWNYEIEITMYLKYGNDKLYFNVLSNQDPQLRPPVFNDFQISNHSNTSSEWHETLDRIDHPSFMFMKREWIGNCCRFVNKKRKLTVNWTYFVYEESPRRRRKLSWNQEPTDHVL